MHVGAAKIRARIGLSLRAVRPNSRVHLHCNHHAHAEFDDRITLLAPQWGSAVHFAGAQTRARIALSLRAVRSNSRVNLHCNHHAHAEFDDGISLLAPQWGSAADFGGAKIRARIALSLRAVRPHSRVDGTAVITHTRNSTTVSHFWLPNEVCS